MAIIKTNRNWYNVSLLFEDPQPGSDNLFIQTDAHSKTTLNPILNAGIIYTSNGSVIGNEFGYSGVSQHAATYTWRIGGILQLNGETTHVRQQSYAVDGTTRIFGVADKAENNMDISPFVSMDTTYRIKPTQYFTDGVNNMVISTYNYSLSTYIGAAAYNNHYTPFVAKINTTPNDFLNSGYMTMKGTGQGGNTADSYSNFAYITLLNAGNSAWPLYRNPATGNLVWIATNWLNNSASSTTGASWKPAFSAAPTVQAPTAGYSINYTGQFVGASKLDSFSIQLHNSVQYDYYQTFYKYNDASNTTSAPNLYNTAPQPAGQGNTGQYIVDRHNGTVASVAMTGAGAGTSSFTGKIDGNVLTVTAYVSGPINPGQILTGTGVIAGTTVLAYTTSTITTGDRTSTFGGYLARWASKTFTDTVTNTVTNTVGFYTPLIDSTGKFHPLYFSWDQTKDFITRYTDISVYYPAGTTFSTYWAPDTASASSLSVTFGYQRAWYNETFLGNDGRRYLTFMQLHGAGGLFDSNILQRTFVTYQISTSSYRSLTYHSSIAIPSTPKNICWLNDGRTLLAVIAFSATYIYNFNTSTGWVNTVTFPYSFTAIGRDNLGRVWASDTGPTQWGRLHLLSGVPASVAVVSTASSFNYAGTVIPTSFAVDAYDLTGSRMTATVNLSVAGNSIKLTTSSGSTNYFSTLTVVTNTSTSTTVYGSVISNGYSSINTTFTI